MSEPAGQLLFIVLICMWSYVSKIMVISETSNTLKPRKMAVICDDEKINALEQCYTISILYSKSVLKYELMMF